MKRINLILFLLCAVGAYAGEKQEIINFDKFYSYPGINTHKKFKCYLLYKPMEKGKIPKRFKSLAKSCAIIKSENETTFAVIPKKLSGETAIGTALCIEGVVKKKRKKPYLLVKKLHPVLQAEESIKLLPLDSYKLIRLNDVTGNMDKAVKIKVRKAHDSGVNSSELCMVNFAGMGLADEKWREVEVIQMHSDGTFFLNMGNRRTLSKYVLPESLLKEFRSIKKYKDFMIYGKVGHGLLKPRKYVMNGTTHRNYSDTAGRILFIHKIEKIKPKNR